MRSPRPLKKKITKDRTWNMTSKFSKPQETHTQYKQHHKDQASKHSSNDRDKSRDKPERAGDNVWEEQAVNMKDALLATVKM